MDNVAARGQQQRGEGSRHPALSPPVWIGRLAMVELQLILQQLDTPSKLRLARCCRHTLAAASGALAWAGAAPVRVSFHSLRTLPSHAAQSALQHCMPLTLCELYGLHDGWQARLQPHAPFFGFDAAKLFPATIQAVLQLPSLQRLRWLRFDMPLREAAEAETLVAGLPMLQSLVLGSAVDDRPAALLPLLQAGALPQLTEVNCDAYCWNRSLSHAAFVGQLRRLSLFDGYGLKGAVELVAGPLSALQRLRLVGWQLHLLASEQAYAAEWPVVLSCLRSLQVLELENTVLAEHLIGALDCVPSLRELRYELRYYPQGRVAEVPPIVQDALLALQDRRPLLHVVQAITPRGCSCRQERSVAEQLRSGSQICCPAGKRMWDTE